MTTSLVTPGTEIGTVGEHQAGEGTTTVDDRIVATTTGHMRIEDGQIIVDASKSIVNIEIGEDGAGGYKCFLTYSVIRPSYAHLTLLLHASSS